MVMRNGCLTRSARLAKNKHIATHTNVCFHDNLQRVAYFCIHFNIWLHKPTPCQSKWTDTDVQSLYSVKGVWNLLTQHWCVWKAPITKSLGSRLINVLKPIPFSSGDCVVKLSSMGRLYLSRFALLTHWDRGETPWLMTVTMNSVQR